MAVSVSLTVCLEQDYAKSSAAIFMKPGKIMDYRHGKNLLSFEIDPTQNGTMAAIMDFCYYVLNRDYGDNRRAAFVVGIGRGMCFAEPLWL